MHVMTMPEQLFEDVTKTLLAAKRQDLVDDMKKACAPDFLTTQAAADLLGVSSPNTVKNWLNGGYFPGAYRTKGRHWRFPRAEVLEAKKQMEALRDKNRRNDLAPPEVDADHNLPLL